jgi:O-acetyl-ADP-ribose deacetylase (regulator of RNase III)
MNEEIAEVHFGTGKEFQVVVGDLLSEDTDCIVNAANSHLAHGGGVAAIIARAAGPKLVEEGDLLIRENGPVATGEAVVTTAGNLPFKGVIHAVGPRRGEGDEDVKIASALQSSFFRGQERGWESISFPAVSSGIFGVPSDVCARAYMKAVTDFWLDNPDSSLKRIRLVLFEGPVLDALTVLLKNNRNFRFNKEVIKP